LGEGGNFALDLIEKPGFGVYEGYPHPRPWVNVEVGGEQEEEQEGVEEEDVEVRRRLAMSIETEQTTCFTLTTHTPNSSLFAYLLSLTLILLVRLQSPPLPQYPPSLKAERKSPPNKRLQPLLFQGSKHAQRTGGQPCTLNPVLELRHVNNFNILLYPCL